jgi:aminoglycoside phosphotransferase (APT) family kinase protein
MMPSRKPDPINSLHDALRAVVTRALGRAARIIDLRRVTGGTSHDCWAFDALVEGESRPRPLILRRDYAREVLDLDLASEFALLKRLHSAGIAVPEPLVSGTAESEIGTAFMISERLSGGDLRKYLATQQLQSQAVAVGLVELQAKIHGLDWRTVAGTVLGDHGQQTVPHLIDQWTAIAERMNPSPDPLLAAAIDRLRTNIPAVESLSLLHGDYKANNIVAGFPGGFAAIDWELAHIGDPLEDLAWTLLWRTPTDVVGGMMSPQAYLAAYQAATGIPIDSKRLAFWQLFVLVKLTGVFFRSMRLLGESRCLRPTHVLLGRAIPWIQRQIAERLEEFIDMPEAR